MIVFGVCVSDEEQFAKYARPGIVRAAPAHPVVIERRGQKSIFSAYNSILQEAQGVPDLEALVLLHDDTEILDDSLHAKLRALFADESIGLAGAIGARGVTSLAWWEGDRRGRVIWNGPSLAHGPRVDDFGFETADVDCVDGLLLALSPWTVRNVAFDDEAFSGFHGYDVDFAFRVRQAGKRVVVSDLKLHHHDNSRHGFSDRPGFLRANIRWRAKWGFASPTGVLFHLCSLALRSKASSARMALGRATRR